MSNVRADDLLHLLELARSGRMVDAAQRLGVEHSTVSRRITALEKAIGRRLVDRTSGGWTLTDDGEALIAHAESIESALHSAAQLAAGQYGRSLSGTVRIAATDGLGSTVVAEALVELRRAHPALEIELTTATRKFDVTSKDYDVAITLQQLQSRRLAVRRLTDYALGLYATRRYLETHPPVRRREDLADHALAWYVESLLDVPELDVFESDVIPRRPVLRSSNIFAQLSFVTAHGGIGLLPRYLVVDRPDLEPVLPDEVSVRLTFWLVARKDSLSLARVQAAVECLTTHVASLQHRLL
jgi:molybdate transport repressor ModE-like protein